MNQREFLTLFQDLLKVSKPIFIDRNLLEWRQIEKETKVEIWEIAEDRLVKGEQIQNTHIIGQYRLDGENSPYRELWFDIEANKDFNMKAQLDESNFNKLKEATKKLIDALVWIGISQDFILLKTSGRGMHVHVFIEGIRDDEQYRRIIEAILRKADLPNIKSDEYLKLQDTVFGIDRAATISKRRKIRTWGGENDKLSGTVHYCSNIGIEEFFRKKKYPFVEDPKEIVYPPINIFRVDQTFLRRLTEISTEELTRDFATNEEIDYDKTGDFAKLYECPKAQAIKQKAETVHHLTNPERVFLSQTFGFFGDEGEAEIHKIISQCKDYDKEHTQYQIENMQANHRKPITCEWTRNNVGCPGDCKGPVGGVSPIKFAWKPPTLEELKAAFSKWLTFTDKKGRVDFEPLEIMLSAALDRKVKGDPAWLFIVGPSGAMKTELVRSLSKWDVYSLDSLTSKTLISGLKDENKQLIEGIYQDLDGKILVLKDFTLILTKPEDERNEIMGQLRNAYDGYLDYGHGTHRKLIRTKSSFGLIAVVTNVIDTYHNISTILGERYLKIRLRVDQDKAVKRSTENFGHEVEMRAELEKVTTNFLRAIDTSVNVEVDPEIMDLLIELAKLIGGVRTPVWSGSIMPDSEVATRLVKQLLKMLKMLCIVRGKTKANNEDLDTIMRVGFDTMPPIRLAILEHLRTSTESDISMIMARLRLHYKIVFDTLNDLANIGGLIYATGPYYFVDDAYAGNTVIYYLSSRGGIGLSPKAHHQQDARAILSNVKKTSITPEILSEDIARSESGRKVREKPTDFACMLNERWVSRFIS